MATTRENRRRKIVDRGSDRLALISGLVPNPNPNHRHHPGSVDFDSSGAVNLPTAPAVSAPVSPVAEVKSTSSSGLRRNKSFDADTSPALSAFRPPLPPSSSSLSSSNQSSSSHYAPRSSAQHSQPKMRQLDLLTPAQVSFAISATEQTRILYSGAAAILVVLSNWGFPILGTRFINTLISFRPLILLLLTNMTVVIAKMLDNPGVPKRGGEQSNAASSEEDYAWADQLGKTLEVGLVMQKAFDAIAMDCGMYAVIITCGLCFV